MHLHNKLTVTSTAELVTIQQSMFLEALSSIPQVISVIQRRLHIMPEAPIINVITQCGYTLKIDIDNDGHWMLFVDDKSLIRIDTESGIVSMSVISSQDANEIASSIAIAFSEYVITNDEDDGVWVEFTHMSQDGIRRHRQFIKCPSWDDISNNYPNDTRSKIINLMNIDNPWDRGRLLIWHGDPGTGKTFAVRSLMMH